MTHYHVIRHAESEANLTGHIICGRSSGTPISVLGQEQPRHLGRKYNKEGLMFDAIYASTAVRAGHTAINLAEVMHFKIEEILRLEALEEKDQGEWTGKERSSIYTPEVLKIFQETDGGFAPPGGESDRDAGRRFYKELVERIIPATKHMQHVAIVSHGVTIRCMLQYELGYPVTFKDVMGNTGVALLAYTPAGDCILPEHFKVLGYNDLTHLPN